MNKKEFAAQKKLKYLLPHLVRSFLDYRVEFKKVRGRPNEAIVRIWENLDVKIKKQLKEMRDLIGQLG